MGCEWSGGKGRGAVASRNLRDPSRAQDDSRNLLEQWLQSVSWRRAERFPLWVFSLASAVGRSRESFCMTMAIFTLPDLSRRAAAVGWSTPVAAMMMRWARSMSLALLGWTLTMRLP